MLLLRGKYEDAIESYDQAIANAIVAEDWLWNAGALLGKATAKMMII